MAVPVLLSGLSIAASKFGEKLVDNQLKNAAEQLSGESAIANDLQPHWPI